MAESTAAKSRTMRDAQLANLQAIGDFCSVDEGGQTSGTIDPDDLQKSRFFGPFLNKELIKNWAYYRTSSTR